MSDYEYSDLPPQDVEAERALLGCMILSRDQIADAVETGVVGADFYQPNHETVFDVITDMYTLGQALDAVTIGSELQSRGVLSKVGGYPYLHTLMQATPVAAYAGHYATIVRDKATLRRLADAAARIRSWAVAGHGDVSDLVDRAQAEMFAAMPRITSSDYHLVGDLLEATLDDVDQAKDRTTTEGVPTGFYDLDDLLGGLHPGQMITVAGRPAMGKSTLALDFCRSASIRHGMASVIYSLEMTRHEITLRTVSAEAKVPLTVLRHGNLSEEDWQRVALAASSIARAPLFIDDSPNMTMTEIRAKSRRLVQEEDLRLIVIDYMQLMSSGKRVENRQVEVSEFSRQIKLMAKELGVPVVALSQLNRGPEQRTNKRPMMSDLRESGSIEQDSDVVILMHREDAYEKESSRPGEADLIVAKHRNGPTRDIAVAAQLHYSRFTDLARL